MAMRIALDVVIDSHSECWESEVVRTFIAGSKEEKMSVSMKDENP